MFYKIGFWVLLAIVIACGALFIHTNPMKNQGAMSWIDIYSEAPAETLKFLETNFDIKVVNVTKMQDGGDYNVIKSRGAMWPFAGVMQMPKVMGATPGSMIYLTVKDYAAAHARALENGAKVILEDMYAEGMHFGVYEIPGKLKIGIVQYVKEEK